MDTQLTEAQRILFQKWLSEKVSNHNCPMCEQSVWTASNHFLIDNMAAGGQVSAGEVVLYYALFCGNCGYATRFNASIVGGVDEQTFGIMYGSNVGSGIRVFMGGRAESGPIYVGCVKKWGHPIERMGQFCEVKKPPRIAYVRGGSEPKPGEGGGVEKKLAEKKVYGFAGGQPPRVVTDPTKGVPDD